MLKNIVHIRTSDKGLQIVQPNVQNEQGGVWRLFYRLPSLKQQRHWLRRSNRHTDTLRLLSITSREEVIPAVVIDQSDLQSHRTCSNSPCVRASDWRTGCINSSCSLSVLIHLEWAPRNRQHSPQTCLPIVTCIWLDLFHFYIYYGSKLVCSTHVHNTWIWIRLTTSLCMYMT